MFAFAQGGCTALKCFIKHGSCKMHRSTLGELKEENLPLKGDGRERTCMLRWSSAASLKQRWPFPESFSAEF